MALPSANNQPIRIERPIDLADPRFKTRIDVSNMASIPLVFGDNWLINYVHALEERMGNLPNVEVLEKFGPQITSLTDLSLNSANEVVQLKAKDTLHDASLKAVNDNIAAFKAQHTMDVKSINDKATKDRTDLVAADAADKKALTERIALVEQTSTNSDSKHSASIAQCTAQIKQLQDAGTSATTALETLSGAVLQANTAASKANTDLITVKTDASNVKLRLTELAAEVKAASQAAQSSIPVGTIIDWLGGFYNLDVPAGFWPCDGTVINDPTSVLNGKKAPDLREVYTAGATDGKGSGTILDSNTYNLKASDLPAVKLPDAKVDYTPSGSVSVNSAGAHTHVNRVSYGQSSNQLAIPATGNGYLNQDIATNSAGDHSHSASFYGAKTTFTVQGAMLNTGAQTAIDTRPKTLYVTKLIKI